MASGFYPLDPPSFDDPADPSAPPVTAVHEARRLYSNPLDYRLDAKGRLIAGHPVDQGMALSMSVEKGSIKSAPEVGNELRKVAIGTARTEADVQDRVLSSFPLSRYVAEQDVKILRIRHEERPAGGLLVSVDYRNLRTGVDAKAFYHENQP